METTQRQASDPRLVRISKALSYILRHGAVEAGLSVRGDGFVKLDHLMALERFSRVSTAEIHQMVADDSKGRFSLVTENGEEWIRANQGHSMQGVIDEHELLVPVSDPAEVPVCVHGTYLRFYDAIKSEGLKRMKRTHIYFATGLPGVDGVRSGMRSDCEVLVYIDVSRAMADGCQFFRSSNGVILSPGFAEGGVIPPHYFERVVLAKPPHTLL